jgi:hypothetical protein
MSEAAGEIEAKPDYGPKMRALDNDRQRMFVAGLFSAPPKGRGQHIWAARFAGYGKADGTSSNKVLGVIAARLLADQRVIDAVQEESQRRLRLLPPVAIQALEKLISDSSHRDHMRAVAAVIDRVDPLQQNVSVNVRHDPAPTIEMTQKVIDKIEQLARRAGVPALPAPIDAEFAVVATEEAK